MKKITSILVIFLTAFFSLHAQSLKVSGIVLDETNYPMVGVGVIEKGNTSNGTVTDIDGKFELTVEGSGSILSLSYIGYESMEVAVQSAPMTITMTPSSLALDDVVVVAYGVWLWMMWWSWHTAYRKRKAWWEPSLLPLPKIWSRWAVPT